MSSVRAIGEPARLPLLPLINGIEKILDRPVEFLWFLKIHHVSGAGDDHLFESRNVFFEQVNNLDDVWHIEIADDSQSRGFDIP